MHCYMYHVTAFKVISHENLTLIYIVCTLFITIITDITKERIL